MGFHLLTRHFKAKNPNILLIVFPCREFAIMFTQADKNKNGRIDFDEFVDMMLPGQVQYIVLMFFSITSSNSATIAHPSIVGKVLGSNLGPNKVISNILQERVGRLPWAKTRVTHCHA